MFTVFETGRPSSSPPQQAATVTLSAGNPSVSAPRSPTEVGGNGEATSTGRRSSQNEADVAGGSATPAHSHHSAGANSNNSNGNSHSKPRPKPKRSQVARACDWCRVHRSKCDTQRPCTRCRERGGRCLTSGPTADNPNILAPHVYREVERLRDRVQELETELEKEQKERQAFEESSSASASDHLYSNSLSSSPIRRPANISIEGCDGIHLGSHSTHGGQPIWYGPASLFNMASRIDDFLSVVLPEGTIQGGMLLNSYSMLIEGRSDVLTVCEAETHMRGNLAEMLSPAQEEYFLEQFWQSYYTSTPILDELQFKEHYRSLWTTSDTERASSSLVDIVVALGIQYGMASLPGLDYGGGTGSPSGMLNGYELAMVGRRYYLRCRAQANVESDNPTLSTLQCHLLCAVYLCHESLQNMSDGARTSAIRTAYMLGLHLEPSELLPRAEKELRKRLWWAVYVLETKIGIKLGRPFLLNESNITCSLPAADRDIAMLTSIEKAPLGKDVSWLSWNVEQIKLHIAARATYTAFYEKPPRPTSSSKEMSMNDQPDPLEIHAAALEKDMKRLDHWVDNVPGALKTARHNGGVPYSTDTASLDFEIFAPLWIQRQRILLELNYHNMCTNLCRPLITFSPKQQPTPAADRGAARSAAHAITLTHMIHQVLLETSILTGWHEAFHWQWNAAVTLAGFALAYPHSELVPAARRALDHCIINCENFGLSMPIAANAVPIIHDLGRKVTLRISLLLGEVPDLAVNFSDNMEISALLPALPDLEDAEKIDFASKAFLNYQLAWPDIFLDTSNNGIEKEPALLQFPDTYPDPFPLSSPEGGLLSV